MRITRKLLPSPAIVVALIALFISLGGTAVAAGIVPLAKRALVADKLANRGENALLSRASRAPGPASSAAGLVAVKTAPWSLAPGAAADFTVMCDSGQKAVAGGFEDPNGWAHSWDSRPTSDGAGWRTFVSVGREATSGQSGTVHAICLK